jgi:hypothetical protein
MKETSSAHVWCSACGLTAAPGTPLVRRDGLYRHATCAEADHGRRVGRQGAPPTPATSPKTDAKAQQLELPGAA